MLNHDDILKSLKGNQYEPDCDPRVREQIASSMIEYNQTIFPTKIHKNKEMEMEGLIPLGELLSKEQIKDVREYLKDKKVCTSHVIYPGAIFHEQNGDQFNCFALQDVLGCPHLLNVATNPKVLESVEGYLGCVPTLYSMNLWWSRAGFPNRGPQSFHRDMDDFKFCTIFIYLVDVDESTGPHIFIKKTHSLEALKRVCDESIALSMFPPQSFNGYGYDSLYNKYLSNEIITLTGDAGTSYMLDTFGVHMGGRVINKDRLVIWLRYGIHKNPPTEVQIPTPIDIKYVSKDCKLDFTDERNRFITRLLIQ